MAHGRNAESQLSTAASAVESDKLRFIQGGLSKQLAITNLAEPLDAPLVARGFQKTATAEDGLFEKVSVRNENGNYLVDELTDSVIWANLNTAGTSITYTLPAALSAYDAVNDRGPRFTLKVMVPFAGRTLTLQPQPLELIDESASFEMAGADEPVYVTLISNGADWIIVGG